LKLSAHKSAPTPESRAERLRRKRAAATALATAYPGVQQLRFELTFEEPGSQAPAAQSHLLYPPARAFFEFPCPHADCDGQFDLTAAVRHTVTDRSHASRGTIACAGSRAFDHPSRRPCGLHLVYAVAALL